MLFPACCAKKLFQVPLFFLAAQLEGMQHARCHHRPSWSAAVSSGIFGGLGKAPTQSPLTDRVARRSSQADSARPTLHG